MRCRACYISSRGERIDIDRADVSIGTAEQLRGRSWDVELGARSVKAASRPARNVTVSARFLTGAAADALALAAERDMAANSPGVIEVDGRWRQRALVTGAKASGIFGGSHSEELTVALLDGCWWRERSLSLAPTGGGAPDGPLDLPCDLPADLMGTRPPTYIENSSYLPAQVKITFFGPASDPSVRIGRNLYKVEIDIPDGARVEVDAFSFPRSIRLVTAGGDAVDEFASGARGTGAGGGLYVFEPLPPGPSEVFWDGSFGVDIEWKEETGWIPWAS